MAAIQLSILLTATFLCFLDGVVSVTDKEFEDLSAVVYRQAAMLDKQGAKIDKQAAMLDKQGAKIDKQVVMIEKQSVQIQQLRDDKDREVQQLMEENERQNRLIEYLFSNGYGKDGQLQNITIEERVEILEGQVVILQNEVSDIETDVNFLFDEQIIQDERLLGLEQETDAIDTELDIIDDGLEGLQDVTLALDFRVTVLEDNGGSDGNSSVAELEVRVETLEGTAADQETRISVVESEVSDLEETVADHETRLTAAQENIQGLQITDVDLDARVTALEENGGDGGNGQNGTIAFHTVLTFYSSISTGSPVVFNEVLVNEGDGYDTTTGTFTVPPDGDGFYYFSVYLLVQQEEYGRFDILVNGEMICEANAENIDTTGDETTTSCSAIAYATEGDTVQVAYRGGYDTTPVYASPSYYYNGFTGFRI